GRGRDAGFAAEIGEGEDAAAAVAEAADEREDAFVFRVGPGRRCREGGGDAVGVCGKSDMFRPPLPYAPMLREFLTKPDV
ncbi:MAG: hypothetical protein SFV23_03700, partial [Planctomycetaceae bacterium]|nr:hypothetical protein [Planctomycetaceae bacterium]